MWARRGHEFASKTAEEDFTAMREAARKAVADLDRSLELRPKLVAAMCEEISVGMATADLERLSEMKDRALKVCPGCLKVRIAYMGTLTPRWGGTYEAMRAFVMESPLRLNPRFRMLAGQVDLDRAELAEIANDDAGALVAIDDAAKADNHFSYLVERARILLRLKRYDEAVATLDRADAQRPMHPPILAQRAIAHYGRQEYVGAGRDLLTTLRLDPTDSDAKAYIDYVVKGVLYQARQLDLAGKHEEALEVAELGLDLAPTDHDAQNTHAWTVLGDATTPERVAALKTKVAASPGDFRAVQQLDYALNKQGQLEPIPPMWNAYLAVHADDGRAYMERAGAYHHLGRNAEAMADTQRACQLGINEGCERAAR
jgi:tetratricopeptide (TPR) repeat protein